ncbi:carbon monoxide dehydrogenase [Pusillimonas sp. DMV24BSW_D]|jgi:carbon-monoxide dehydrogenase medium subunit|uniref:FAD binding domain-containing protein n=1 Tax=Neopusillimonas aestuarii TaxID=2716226 RepID=UPI001408EF8F|nr:FAD binding domain-containing protein [Pusillimonas sp. DMV24BSW_D]QIM48431.1 carbon monoxide dehydrogenase [Pusillimonas sp. DMV24BSW_D]|tara:strand:- start:655 stop:1485 length:831 start_codon:yes stop_codon:yes gene_type:complete
MKAAKFDYVRVSEAKEALSLLEGSDGSTKAMGGSQSLGPMLNLRLARPQKVVDVSGIADWRTVSKEAGRIRVGAAVTHAEIEDGVFAELRGHMLQDVAGVIAYRAVRNRGTIAGSIAHADPAADWVLATSALGAELELTSAKGSRRSTMPEFMLGAYAVDLQPDELISAVYVPEKTEQTRWGYYKFCRKTGEFAEASCAAYFDPSTRTARIVVGALGGAPQLLPGLSAKVAQEGLAAATPEAIAEAVKDIAPEKTAGDRRLFMTVIERCLRRALGE